MTDRPATEKQERFVDALFETKGNVKAAAEIAGLSLPRAYELFKGNLRKVIIQRAEEILALHAVKAAFALADGIDEKPDVPMSPLRLESAKQILDRAGLVKKEQIDINASINTPLFILPAKDEDDSTSRIQNQET